MIQGPYALPPHPLLACTYSSPGALKPYPCPDLPVQLIREPVLLCATGQIYDYDLLKEWFRTGHRICPKTNVEVLDVQVRACKLWMWIFWVHQISARGRQGPFLLNECTSPQADDSRAGPLTCPLQVTKVPWLKARIQEW